VVVAVFAIVAMILLAFVVDRGRIYVERSQLQNAADAAALAAVQATCQASPNNEAAAKTIAEQYLVSNGFVPVSVGGVPENFQVIVQDGPNDATTGVSVAVERPVPAFFGGFVGVDSSTVAARATALRECLSPFRFVSATSVRFSGGGSDSGRIYAGKCFLASGAGGGGPDPDEGAFFEAVAVSIEDDDVTTCLNSPFGNPFGPNGIEPGSSTVRTSLYGVPDPGLSYAYSQTTIGATPGYTEADMDAKLANASLENCLDFTRDIVCTAPAGVTVPNGTGSTPFIMSNNIIASGPVTIPNNARFTGDVVYTTYTTGTSPVVPAVQLGAGGSDSSVYFAPNGLYQGSGSADDDENAGIGIANRVDFNGGSQNAAGGANLRSPGPWRLSQ
jgi:Flp pilus assembly protein TadG